MGDERRSDTEKTFGGQNPPADASNQNAEEPSAPTGSDAGGGGQTRPGAQRDGDENPGGAGEHSQATGHPDNAG